MSETPQTRYARHDEVTIAYQAIGDGSLDIALVPTGLSDPVFGPTTLEEQVGDVLAVLDAAGSTRALLLGVFEGAALAVGVATSAPERVAGLVLYAGLAKFTADGDYPWGWSPAAIQLYLSASEDGWGTGAGAELLVTHADERYRSWYARLVRLSASPGMATTLLKTNTSLDVRELLARLESPTLVLHRRDDPIVDVEHGRLELRARVHTGECELLGDDLGGIAVHVAARVAASAGSGAILVSESLPDLVAGAPIRFAERSRFTLKGLTGERRLLAAELDS